MSDMMKYQPQSYEDLVSLAKVAARSSICAVETPEDALVILMTGAELGLTAMQSLRGIYIVKKRPVLAADTMAAVVRKSGVCATLHLVESTEERCTYKTRRKDDDREESVTWTMEDAKRAQLAGGDTWKKYPQAMLRARTLATICRAVYPDVLLGLYDPDELEPQQEEQPALATVTQIHREPQAVAQIADIEDAEIVEESKPAQTPAPPAAPNPEPRTPNPGPMSAAARKISEGEEHDALREQLREYLRQSKLHKDQIARVSSGFIQRYGDGASEMGRVPLARLREGVRHIGEQLAKGFELRETLLDLTEWAVNPVDTELNGPAQTPTAA